MANPETIPAVRQPLATEEVYNLQLKLAPTYIKQPFTKDDVHQLSHVLHGGKKGHPNFLVESVAGNYVINFWNTDLQTAVERVDSALFSGVEKHFSHAVIDQALIEDQEATKEATKIFDAHRQQLAERAASHIAQVIDYEIFDFLQGAA